VHIFITKQKSEVNVIQENIRDMSFRVF
jgi:hypothetical protein